VTTSYNQAQFLEATFESVLSQGYPNLEYIVIDDESTDGSVDIVRRYSRHFAHWQIGPHSGQAANIAKGFEMATGEVLGFLSSDDVLMPGALATVASVFRATPASVAVAGRCLHIDEKGEHLEVITPRRYPWWMMVLVGHGLQQPATFWRRDVYAAVGGLDPDMLFSFDSDLFVRLRRSGAFAFTRHCLAAFRIHPASKSSTWQTAERRENIRIAWRYGAAFGIARWAFEFLRTFRFLRRLKRLLPR
jgi:glycosyltransferase involved in cell wall biosynthesis